MSNSKPGALDGRMVVDRQGNKVGKIREVYLDDQTDQPKWGVVKTGRIAKRRFLPLVDADTSDDEIRLPFGKSQVDDAPDVEEDEHLSPKLESRLERHYARGGSAEGKSRGPDNGPASRGAGRGAIAAARTRQREEFGGFNWGAALLGWLVAGGIAAILTAIVSGAGAAIGFTKVSASSASSSADTIGIVGAAVLILVLAIAYYTGGYNAGRLSRFDGGRQGFGVWLTGLIITLVLGAVGAVFGSEYNVLQKLDVQPRVPVDEGSLATAGLIALAALVLVTLLAAILGGKAGERYHRKVDRAGA